MEYFLVEAEEVTDPEEVESSKAGVAFIPGEEEASRFLKEGVEYFQVEEEEYSLPEVVEVSKHWGEEVYSHLEVVGC